MAHNIRTELVRLAQPIGSIEPHPRNVRQGDIGAIATSLEAHGQYRPIVVHKSTTHILAGNHTYHAARSLGWDKVACTFVDCSDEQALRILLADNRANDLATYDDSALTDLLQELANSEGLEGTLYELSDLDDLIKLLEPPDLQEVIDKIGEHDNDDFTGMIKVRVSLSVYERWKDCYASLTGDTDDERILSLLYGYESQR